MPTPDSRSEYRSRMHRVLETIDRQLDLALDLETLAAEAHFSPFHFHRLFAAWMGETLGDYLRRRRVEVAAMRLAAQPRTRNGDRSRDRAPRPDPGWHGASLSAAAAGH